MLEEQRFGKAGARVVLEEFLGGEELTVMAFADGRTVIPMIPAQDHKRIGEGDTGPNTGGMGAYAPAPLGTLELRERILHDVLYPAVRGLSRVGSPYYGVLYAGLMITADGPKVLEFNARFGDPETQVLMARMNYDIVPVMKACTSGTMLAMWTMAWHPEPGVCVVMAAEGYPGPYEKGRPITGLQQAGEKQAVQVFHAGTKKSGGDVVTSGGRVLGVTALGADFATAIDNAYTAVGKIHWEGIHYRKDIGHRARPSPLAGEAEG